MKRRTDGRKGGWKEGKTGEKKDRRAEGRMEGGERQVKRRTDGRKEGKTGEKKDSRTVGQTEKQRDREIDRRTHGQMDRQTDINWKTEGQFGGLKYCLIHGTNVFFSSKGKQKE